MDRRVLASTLLLGILLFGALALVPSSSAVLVGSVVRFPTSGCPNQFLGSAQMPDGRTNSFYIADLGASDKRLHQVIYNADGTIDYDAAISTSAGSTCAGINADVVTLSTGYQLRVISGTSGSVTNGLAYSPDGITWVPTTALSTLTCGGMVHLYLKTGDEVGLSCQQFVGGSPDYALAIYKSSDMFQTYTTVQAGGLLSNRFFIDDKHMLHGPGSVDMSPPAPEYSVAPEYGVTFNGQQCQYASNGASSTPTPYPGTGVCANTGITGQVGSAMQFARPAYIGTIEYLVNTVTGTAGGTFDLALFSLQTSGGTSAWVFEKRLTTGENLPTAANIHPWVVSDGAQLVVSYIDSDDSQRKFAVYAGVANPTFQSAGIGNAQFPKGGSFSNGTVRFMATDPTQSTATGQLGLYTVAGFDGGAGADYAAPATENIIGFDVSIDGSNVIYRYTDTGTPSTSFVATLPGQTLSGKLAFFDTGCATSYGVTAALENVAYAFCSGGGSTVTDINVETPDLSTTFVPEDCADVAAGDIEQWSHGLAGISQFHTLEWGSIGYEVHVNFEGGDDECTIFAALAFSDLDGKVGILAFFHFAGTGNSQTETYRAQYTTDAQNGATDVAVCETFHSALDAVEAPEGVYVIAVHDQQPTRTYALRDDQLVLQSSGSGALGGAVSISCSGSANAPALLVTGTGVYGYNYKTGSTSWTIPETNALPLSGAQSWDGKWGSFSTTTTTYIVNMTNGDITGTFDAPSTGWIRGVEMDSTGQALFFWTDSTVDHILKYLIYENTTITPTAPGDPTPDDPDDCIGLSACSPSPEDGGAGTASSVFQPSDESCEFFGSCMAAQGFQGVIALVCGAGLAGSSTVGAAVRMKARISLKVVMAAAGAGAVVAVATCFFLGIVADWFFYMTIVGLIAFLVFMGIRAVGGGSDE